MARLAAERPVVAGVVRGLLAGCGSGGGEGIEDGFECGVATILDGVRVRVVADEVGFGELWEVIVVEVYPSAFLVEVGVGGERSGEAIEGGGRRRRVSKVCDDPATLAIGEHCEYRVDTTALWLVRGFGHCRGSGERLVELYANHVRVT